MGGGIEVVEITDEREPRTEAALRLFETAFDPRDRQPMEELRSEIEEKRLGLLASTDYHLLAAMDGDHVAGAISGVYLEGINAGFIYYLVVDAAYRGREVGRKIRAALVETFRADARRAEWEDLAWVIGEVHFDNPWLRGLVRRRGAIAFDLLYYHPGMVLGDERRYVLYRQPVVDARVELPAHVVTRVLYQIYRRAYRVRYPLQGVPFRTMIDDVLARGSIGAHPEF